MERLLLAQKSLKEAIKTEQEAKLFLDEATKLRIEAQREFDIARQTFIDENKTSSTSQKTNCKVWVDSDGKQHEIEYFVV